MTKNRTNQKSFYYQQTHTGENYKVSSFWCPRDRLSEKDECLLECIKAFYRDNGYSPSRKDVSVEEVRMLKARFRTWKNVLIAAEVPAMNDAESQRRRQKSKAEF